jgi:hypothetical protein
MNAGAAQTNRLVTAAAVAFVGTNLLLASPYAAGVRDSEPGIQEQRIVYPATIPTAVAVSNVSSQPSEITNTAARTVVQDGLRWNSYVARRLTAIQNGTNDFTGLKIPSLWVVDRAWAVARSYFKSSTPPPSVVPTEDGNILYIWRKSGWELHVEVSSEEATAWAYHRRSGHSWSGTLTDRHAKFYALLDLLGQS